MELRSLADFVARYSSRGRDIAYAQPSGYRMERWPYVMVAETAYRFARALAARGISKGDRILLWGSNSAQWAAAFLGAAIRGVVVVPIDDIAADDFSLRIFQQVGAKLIVTSRVHAAAVEALPLILLETLHEIPQTHLQERDVPLVISPSDPLQIVFTSGATSDPKGVIITHGNVLSNLAPLESEIRRYLKYERLVHPIRFLNLLPLSHVFGQFLGIFVPPLLGGTVVFLDSLKPSEILGAIRQERVSVLVAVPRVLDSLREKIERDFQQEGSFERFRTRFSNAAKRPLYGRWWTFRSIHRRFGWKFWAIISGGAALDSETEEFWRRLGYAVIQGYGLTETTSLISVNHPFRIGKGSIGKVLPGREMRLDEDGEILVRGSGVAAGYWSESSSQALSDADGWFRTGDLGETDGAGNLYFKGRKKDVIVTSAGMKIYPQDLEAALRRQPEVRDCLVVSLSDKGNARPCAVLIVHEGAQTDGAGILNRANTLLAKFQRMQDFYIWPEPQFALTSTLKPRRAVVAAAVQRNRASAFTPETKTELYSLIERITRDRSDKPFIQTPGEVVDADLNLSSLDRVALLSAIEDRYQTELSESLFSKAKTIGDIQALVRENRSASTSYHYPDWVQRPPVTWIRLFANFILLRPAVFLLGRARLVGGALSYCDGPVLVVSNHISDVDIGFIIAALPTRIANRLAIATRGEALEALRTPSRSRNFMGGVFDKIKWGLGVSLLNLFPLPTESGVPASFRYAGACADRGYSVLVFPEGQHTPDGSLQPFRPGIGLLVKNLGLPVVPMRIDGLFERKLAGKKFARRGDITVRVGKPLSFPLNAGPEQIARELQCRVAEL